KRRMSISAAARPAAVAGGRVRNASPAPASPKVPVTANKSPARPPLRRSAVPRGTCPNSCTLTVNGPRVVSPPTRTTPSESAKSSNPAENPVSHRWSASGIVSASVAQAGVAPMAARSLKLTASARCPMERASVPCGKCRPATMVSTAATNSVSGGIASNAASSPMPSRTPDCGAWAAPRMKNRRIKSNSPRLELASNSPGPGLATLIALPGRPAVFQGPQFPRGPIQYGVDEFVPGRRAELLGQLYGLGQHHTVRQLRAGGEFVQPQPQHRVFDRIELGRRNLAQAHEVRIQCLPFRRNRREQFAKVIEIDPLRFRVLGILPPGLLPGPRVDLQLI